MRKQTLKTNIKKMKNIKELKTEKVVQVKNVPKVLLGKI